MGCMHSKNNLPKVLDSDTGLPMQKPNCSKKTLKIQNAAKVKMNKAMAEVKAKGDAKLAAALAGFGGIQLPAATIQHILDKQTITKQTPLPEQTTPRQISKASTKNDKMSSTGIDDAEAIPVSISTDVIAKMTINDTMNKAEDLKKKTESALTIGERPTSSAQSTSSGLIIVTEAKSSVDNNLVLPLNQLVGSSTSSLDKATTNLVDAVFTSLDNEETVQESIAGVQRSDAISGCTMPAAPTTTLSLDQEAGFIVDSVLANITKEQLSVEPKMRSTGSTAMDASCQVASLKNLTLSVKVSKTKVL